MDSFAAYPWLARSEFTECCHHLEARYCRATLGPLRRRWKIRTVTSLDMTSFENGAYITYIQIVRPLEVALDSGGLAAEIEQLEMGLASWGKGNEEGMLDQDMETEEQQDQAVIRHDLEDEMSHVGRVTYEIHLHPTYRIPCLWFSLDGLPVDEPPFDVETVFRRLVPDEFKSGLRALAHTGGISMDHHPITGVPSFFIHPCLLGDAMNGFADRCTKENYLMLWLGLVGGCVGLWVPKEMAQVGSLNRDMGSQVEGKRQLHH